MGSVISPDYFLQIENSTVSFILGFQKRCILPISNLRNFETEIVTFVPPGNVFSRSTELACAENGIRRINCNTQSKENSTLRIIGNERVIAFHDREVVLEGVNWLEKKIATLPEQTMFSFVKDL